MRTLALAFALLGTSSFASGTTIVNTAPDVPASDVKLRPSPSTRLIEIERELRNLSHRTTGTEIFARKMGSMAPWLAVSAIPLMVVGGAIAIFGNNGANKDLILIPAGVVAGIAVAASLIAALISLVAVFDHWAQELASSGDRHERERVLRTERQELLLRL